MIPDGENERRTGSFRASNGVDVKWSASLQRQISD